MSGCRKNTDSLSEHNNHVSPFSERLMNVLYLTAFLAYGLCDSVSAAYLMTIGGVGAERNPILRYIFMENGASGFIMFKLWATVIILATLHLINMKSRECTKFTVGGFLLTFTLGGILATLANLSKASGTSFPLSSNEILLIFVVSFVISITLGDILDTRYQKKLAKKLGNENG